MKHLLLLLLTLLSPKLFAANDVRIRGNSSGTYEVIGNVGDRLKVDAALSAAPQTNAMTFMVHLKNGSATNQKVNGSSVNVNYDATPGSGETWYATELHFVIVDSGPTSFSNYGAINGGLTNGVQILIRSGGVEYTVTVDPIKDNTDIAKVFGANKYITPTSGFFETSDVYIGTLVFDQPIVLSNANSDYVRMKIRDNLTTLDLQECMVKYWRSI